MNIMSNGSFLDELSASNKQSELVKKLTATWEKKNTKAARAGGASLMALYLAACGGDDDNPFSQADVTAAEVAAAAAVDITSNDAEVAAAATAAVDITTDNDVASAAGFIAGAASVDITSDNDEASAAGFIAGAASVDITTDNAAAAAAAAAAVDITTDNAAAVTAALTDAAGVVHADVDAAIASNDAAIAAAVDITTDNAAATDTAVAAATDFTSLDALVDAFNAAVNPPSVSETLTTANNNPSLTNSDDTITGAATNSLNTGDSLIDPNTSDNDTLTANTSVNNAAPQMVNIEAVTINGVSMTTGLDLANVTGTDSLTFTTALSGGSATVTNASAAAAGTITAGTNVSTLDVTAAAAGAGALTVVGGSATTVNLTGGAATDTFTASLDGGGTSAVVLATMAAADTVNLTTAGNINLDGVIGLGNLNVNATDNVTVTVTSGNETALTTDFTGAGNVVLAADAADIDAAAITAMTSTGSGTLTLRLTEIDTGESTADVVADVVEYAAGATAADSYTIDASSTLNLDADMGVNGAVIWNTDAAGDMVVNVSQSQTGVATTDFTTGGNVSGLVLSATPDAAADTANGAVITLAEVTTNAATNTIAVTGSDALTISVLDIAGDEVLNSTSMTGDLTIGQADAALTAFMGSGDDSFTSTTDVAFNLSMGGGDDTVDLDNTVATAAVVNGEDGDDTILGGDGADTIDGGTGNDSIDGEGGADTITTGSGADTVTIVNGEDGDTITDFVVGTDTLVLTGTSGGSIDATSVTPTTGAYDIDGSGAFNVTLTGSTATDLSSSLQFGTAAASMTLFDTGVYVAGSADDTVIAAADTSNTITTGAGSDTILMTVNTAAADSITVTDFTVGTDMLVLTGAIVADTDISTTVAAGTYTLVTNNIFTLTGVTETTLANVMTIGNANNAATADGTTVAAVVGGNGADHITSAVTANETISITGGDGADVITLTANGTASAVETVVVAANDSLLGSHDQITNFDADGTTADVLDLASTNVGTVFNSNQVGDITGITATNGVITAWTGIDNTINATTLSDALDFLAANVGGTDTVAFLYTADENGDGDTTDVGETSTYVFQNGTTDTVVELIGLTGITALSTTAAANTIDIA
jgi:hypothetical protein